MAKHPNTQPEMVGNAVEAERQTCVSWIMYRSQSWRQSTSGCLFSPWSPFPFLANACALITDITEIPKDTWGLSWGFRAFHSLLAWELRLVQRSLHLPLLLILNLSGNLGWDSHAAPRKIKVLHNCIKCIVVKKGVTNGEPNLSTTTRGCCEC